MYTSPKPYPFLPVEGSIAYVPVHDPFMQQAKKVSETRARGCNWCVGCVFVRDGAVLTSAGNNEDSVQQPIFCARRAIGCKTGEGYDLCGLCSGPHAEATAVLRAQEQGISLAGADAYLYGHWWCCAPCWNAMIGAGVTRVFLVEQATELFEVMPQRRPRWSRNPSVCIVGDGGEATVILRKGLALAGIGEDPTGVPIVFVDSAVRIGDSEHRIIDTNQIISTISRELHDTLIARYAA